MYGPDCPQLHACGLTSLKQRAKRMERPETWTSNNPVFVCPRCNPAEYVSYGDAENDSQSHLGRFLVMSELSVAIVVEFWV